MPLVNTKINDEKQEEQDKDTKQTLSDEDLDQVSGAGVKVKPTAGVL